MTPAQELTLTLESRLVNAWPAFEIELVDGWLLRCAENYSKRANSASPVRPGAALDASRIEALLDGFAARGVAPCFRLTGLEGDGAEAALETRGFVPFEPSCAMTAEIVDPSPHDPTVRFSRRPKAAWIEAAAHAYGADKADAGILGRIVRLIRREAAFATLSLDGEDSAWGLAVTERGYVGLYDIVVAPDLRGLGLGRRLVHGLMAWGRANGASRAYLQMRETNEVAGALYRSFGFEVAYRYSHRVTAERAREAASEGSVEIEAAPDAMGALARPSGSEGAA